MSTNTVTSLPSDSRSMMAHEQPRTAGVPLTAVRYGGIVHDFVGMKPLRHTVADEGAINQGVAVMRAVLNIS